ncbi:MAG TPA: PAS domain-containing protein, partial [Baekduia sp.]|nr:PAS domain-containing protein [Baekduia sp.]
MSETRRSLPGWVWDTQDEGALLLDGDRRVLDANRAACALLDATREALVGRVLPEPFVVAEEVRVREHRHAGRVLVTLADVARQLRARRAIERIAESVEAFLFTRRLDADGVARLVYAGPGVERLLGGPVPPGGTIDQALADALLPDDRERAQAALAATMRGEASLVEYRLAGLDGRVRWVRARMQRREERGVVSVDGMISDVTAERAHAEEMARFRGA